MISWIPLSSEQVGDAKLPAGLIERDLLARLRSTLQTAQADDVYADEEVLAARKSVLQRRIDEITAAINGAQSGAARIVTRLRPLLPDARDLHVYGGGLLVALGAGMYSPAAGLMVFGALLLYLGRP